MISAKNNIIVKIQNSNKPGCMASSEASRNDQPEYAILNPISGSFDLMDEQEYTLLQKINEGEILDKDFSSYLLERGYAFVNQEDQNTAINKGYREFKDEVAKSQVQLMLVPTYGCNLACTYCFQHGIIVDKCADENHELSAVTNGYGFIEYIDILKKVKIKEIQFTLDGSKDIHDNRRATVNKKGTFDRIVAGIEAAVNNKMPVNLRSVVDTENIEDNGGICCCGTEEEKTEVKSATIEDRKTEGCLICGQELLFFKDSPAKETCNICHKQFEAYIKCPKGHYVCDTCHSLDILGKVEQLLNASDEKNPVVLAQKVFELPGLNMHGPEYHSIVPAVLVTAYQNISDHREPSKIKEAMKRGKDIKGGSCGIYGDCGACVGSGIAVSMIEGATPMSHDERGAANRATGYALLEISKYGGPRCCKREAITSIESFLQVTSYFNGIQKAEYTCKQFGKNKDCIGKKCPYFPVKP